MEAIKDTVINVIKELSLKKTGGADKGDPEDKLKKSLTKKELQHIKIHYFRKGILGIKVDSSSWLYSLNLKKEKLLVKLNTSPPAGVKDIRFVIGEVK